MVSTQGFAVLKSLDGWREKTRQWLPFFGVYSLSGALKCFTDGKILVMELLVGLQDGHAAPILRAIPERDLQSTFYQFT